MKKSFKNVPFNPGKFPFFYGWLILGFGTAGMLMSIPGQTVGVSVFTDFLINELSIPRNYLSLAYLVGTIGSALLMTRAGKLYDKLGARTLGTVISFSLGLVLLFLSFSAQITTFFRRLLPGAGTIIIPFIIMSLGFFLVRFTGQGSLTLLSKNMVMEWFEKKRGFANAILGVSVSFGFSYAPRLLDGLIGRFTWQGAWRVLAVIVGGGFAFLVFIFFRNKPEDHGLKPDGSAKIRKRKTHTETTAVKDFTLKEARRTYTFWLLTFALMLSALIVTAFTFHVVSIFESKGLTRTQAIGIFLPSSIIAIGFQFLGSYLSDYIKLKYLILTQLFGQILLCLGIIFLKPGFPVVLIIIGMGINQGLFGVNGNVAWPRFFGRTHLGAVSGFGTAWLVAGSAVGPYLFSLIFDTSGTYMYAALGSLVVVSLLLIGSFKANQPTG